MQSPVARVPVEVLLRACKSVNTLAPDLDDTNLAEHELLVAAAHRLQALVNLITAGIKVRYWISGTQDLAFINEALLHAAADAPLWVRDDLPPETLMFDPRELTDRALLLIEPAGRA
jgi:hypothetical protein